MSTEIRSDAVARRTFLTRLTAAVTAFGAALSSRAAAQAPASGATTANPAPAATAAPPVGAAFQPTRHPEDDWFDQTSAKHRFFMDTTTADGLSAAMGFARNFFEANASGYKLTDADLAQIICLRHHSTSFAFNDAMWTKYSAALAERADDFVDPNTKEAPTVNVYEATGRNAGRGNGVTLSALAKRGVRYAVCAMATRRTASVIADKTGGKIDDIFQELTQHLVPNAHMVSAGIVAVNRAQERGYTASTVV